MRGAAALLPPVATPTLSHSQELQARHKHSAELQPHLLRQVLRSLGPAEGVEADVDGNGRRCGVRACDLRACKGQATACSAGRPRKAAPWM